MKPVCVVDTCSLIILHDIELANRSLHRWLWDEFAVVYSETVWGEIEVNLDKMGNDKTSLRKSGRRYAPDFPQIDAYERALFGQDHHRKEETGKCKMCNRPFTESRAFLPDLTNPKDRGERHNLCLSLEQVIHTSNKQVIFLTDDYLAKRDYVDAVFEDFPVGRSWTSLDLILYIFFKYRNRIPLNMVEAALQDAIANAAGSGRAGQTQEATQLWVKRKILYIKRARRIYRFRSSMQ